MNEEGGRGGRHGCSAARRGVPSKPSSKALVFVIQRASVRWAGSPPALQFRPLLQCLLEPSLFFRVCSFNHSGADGQRLNPVVKH
jgi:hypothetical protein